MFIEMMMSGSRGGGNDIVDWTYKDKIISPSFGYTTGDRWSYTFDFNSYNYFFVVSAFGVLDYWFFDNNNVAHKVTAENPQYPVTVNQNGDTITFIQSTYSATSSVSIYRYEK